LKKLAIVAAHRASRDNAPYQDNSYEIWAIAHHAVAPWMKRCTAVIDIHTAVLEPHPRNPGYWKFMQETDIPIYMLIPDYRVKSAVLYPKQEIKDELLSNISHLGQPVEMFSSTVDYAMALGIYQGYKHIEIYGAEMNNTSGGEYEYQRPGHLFWIGFAGGRGIRVEQQCISDMFHFEYGDNLSRYLMKTWKHHIKFEKG